MKNILKSKLLLIVLIITGFAFTAKMDYNDRMMDFRQYCDDVENGVYPDYKHLIVRCEKYHANTF